MRSPYAQTNLMPLSPHVQQVPSVPPPSFRYHLPDLALGPPPRMIAAGIPSYMGAPHHHRADNVNTPHLDASMCAPCQYPRNDVHGYSGGTPQHLLAVIRSALLTFAVMRCRSGGGCSEKMARRSELMLDLRSDGSRPM